MIHYLKVILLLLICGLAVGAPVGGGDPLMGREFLDVFMRRTQPNNYLDKHNAIPHKEEHFHEFKDISSSGGLDHETATLAASTQPMDKIDRVKNDDDSDGNDEESTNVTNDYRTTDIASTTTEMEEDSTTTEEPTTLIQTTRLERSTTEADWRDQDHPSQVVSVRVSSSVVRNRPEPHHVQEDKTVSVSYRVEAKVADSMPSASQIVEEPIKVVNRSGEYARAEALTYHRIELGSDPQNTPVSYETSVSSASSGSSIRFYREPPTYAYSHDQRQQRTFRSENEPYKEHIPSYNKQEIYPKSDDFKQTEEFSKTSFYRKTPIDYSKPEYSKPRDDFEGLEFTKAPSFTHPPKDYSKPAVFDKPEEDFRESEIFGKRKLNYIKTPQFPTPQPEYTTPQVLRKVDPFTKTREQDYGKTIQEYGKPAQVYAKAEETYNKPSVHLYENTEYGKPREIYEKPEEIYSKTEEVYGKREEVFSKPEEPYAKSDRSTSYGVEKSDDYPKPERVYGEPERVYGEPEQNYEIDEAVSVATNGRAHGVQDDDDGKDKHKFGYVVEGRNFRKYRVEERTSDGFIVGEYGVVSHDDGSLRGVRYTADSNINPRLIYDALVKFLSLK